MIRWPPPSPPTSVVGGGVGGMSCSNRNSSQCQLCELPSWDLIRGHALSEKLLLSQPRIPLWAPQWEEEEGRALSPAALPTGERLSQEERWGCWKDSPAPLCVLFLKYPLCLHSSHPECLRLLEILDLLFCAVLRTDCPCTGDNVTVIWGGILLVLGWGFTPLWWAGLHWRGARSGKENILGQKRRTWKAT